jgi:diaminobutyrate-2-oxoglutarate transaminase
MQVAELLAPLTHNPWVREVRGLGLMWGIELADPETGNPAGDVAAGVQERALRKGLILERGGRDDCVVRMLPPLNVTAGVVDIACRIVLDAISEQVELIRTLREMPKYGGGNARPLGRIASATTGPVGAVGDSSAKL